MINGIDKLASWRGKLLSIGGRLTLIKSCLSNLPVYFMTLFPVPQGIIDKIIKLQRNFLWSGSMDKNTMALINWKAVQLPRVYGGLSVGNILHRNLALMYKWIWRYFAEPNSLWRRVIQTKYKYSSNLTILDLDAPKHGGPWKALCSHIFKHPEAKNIALSGPRKKTGNGYKTLFWFDPWLGPTPLKTLMPRLFSITTHKFATVHSLGFWDGNLWIWNLNWTRSLRPRDTDECATLQNLLKNVCISMENEDELIWAPCKSGIFSVKSFTTELAKTASSHHQVDLGRIWRGLVPPRIEIFTWLACQGKLNTREKLARINIIPLSQDCCPLCEAASESVDHLLLHCTYSWQVWCWWMNLWGLSWIPPISLRASLQQWSFPRAEPFFKKVWLAVFYIITWSLWKERNGRIFNNISLPMEKVCDMILIRLGWWIKGWGDPFPYSCDDIVRNPACLRIGLARSSSQQPKDRLSSWSPPPPSYYKWNVDASMNNVIPNSAIGGVLRNENGAFLCIFSAPTPPMEINNAEVFAIHRAIQITLRNTSRINAEKFIIESDSLNAVKWCNTPNSGPWNLNFQLNFIRNAMRSSPSFSIVHHVRESNHVADALAKQGLRRQDEFLAWI